MKGFHFGGTVVRVHVIKLTAVVGAALALLWLVGYVRALLPFAGDGIRSGDITFLSYPVVKVYRLADETTGIMSEYKVNLFSVSDGPTGIEYTEAYFPCWVVSLAALAALVVGGYTMFSHDTRTHA